MYGELTHDCFVSYVGYKYRGSFVCSSERQEGINLTKKREPLPMGDLFIESDRQWVASKFGMTEEKRR